MINPPGNWRSWKSWLMLRPWQRHSLVLMLGGFVYVGVSVGFFNIKELTPEQERSIVIALQMWDLKWWGVLFLTSGLTAIASSRWPIFSDSWGYTVLTGMSSGWSAIYFLSYLLGDAPSTNIMGGLIWGMMSLLWWAVAGLQNPGPVTVVIQDERA